MRCCGPRKPVNRRGRIRPAGVRNSRSRSVSYRDIVTLSAWNSSSTSIHQRELHDVLMVRSLQKLGRLLDRLLLNGIPGFLVIPIQRFRHRSTQRSSQIIMPTLLHFVRRCFVEIRHWIHPVIIAYCVDIDSVVHFWDFLVI